MYGLNGGNNPMLAAMQGYAFVDNIARQNRQEQRLEEDRQRRIALEDQAIQDQRSARDAKTQLTQALFDNLAPDNPAGQEKVQALVNDPDRVGRIMAGYDVIRDNMNNGNLPAEDVAVRYMNDAAKEELAKRGNDNLTRTIVGLYPSPDGSGIIPEFEVHNPADGKTYRAPMTTKAGTAASGDNDVAQIAMSRIMPYFGGAAATARTIALQMAKAGDFSYLNAYQKELDNMKAGQAELAKENRQQQNKLDQIRAEGDKDIRVDRSKPMTVSADSAVFDPQTGRYIVKGANWGKAGSAKLPAEAQLTEYLVSSGIAPDKDSAWRMARQSKSDPVELASTLAVRLEKSQYDSGIDSSDPNYQTPDQIRDKAVQIVQDMQLRFANNPPARPGIGIMPSPSHPANGKGVGSSKKQGGQEAAQRPAGVPESAVQAKDGNWYAPDPSRPGKYLLFQLN